HRHRRKIGGYLRFLDPERGCTSSRNISWTLARRQTEQAGEGQRNLHRAFAGGANGLNRLTVSEQDVMGTEHEFRIGQLLLWRHNPGFSPESPKDVRLVDG